MLAKFWNIWWTHWLWPLILISAAVVLAILLLPILLMRGCGRPSVKIDHEVIDRINTKNAADARKEVRELVEENLDVTEAVGNRTALAEANAVERDRLIEEKIVEVNKKVAEAKAQGQNVTQEDLHCLLIPSDCR